MKCIRAAAAAALLAAAIGGAQAQVEFTGRLYTPRVTGSAELMPVTAVFCFAAPVGEGQEPTGMRTWELDPQGWFYLSGPPGAYTVAFSQPAHFWRPVILTNQFLEQGQKVDRPVVTTLDFASFGEQAWDEKPATDYYQTFTARGTSITGVGFRLVHDGVDGQDPGSQDFLVSIHRKGPGTPDKWPQVGKTGLVYSVDSGGVKNYLWSANWASGEVPVVPGQTYAVRLRARKSGAGFQAFWRNNMSGKDRLYRVGKAGPTGWLDKQIWLGVSSDRDGLLIPYAKKVQKDFTELTKFAPRWTQTYVARGTSLASVMLYAAWSGVQPGLQRQRCVVRVRKGGPGGPVVGLQKIAIGNGNHTGDASWGVAGAVYAPGEVPLEPGKTYALEFESIESLETLHGYVNIKNMPSDDKPGFNPYKKTPPDTYEQGTAYCGAQKMDYDLDMQVVEYAYTPKDWTVAVGGRELAVNGDAETAKKGTSWPLGWEPFTIEGGILHQWLEDSNDRGNTILRIAGAGVSNRSGDGGWVQRVGGLSPHETYRVFGKARCSWPIEPKHAYWVGTDLTGQTADPKAPTVRWELQPSLHGQWHAYRSAPLRPASDAISIWLRGKCADPHGYFFKADFDDFSVRMVKSAAPGKEDVAR